jgi:hypothetical protein
MLQVQDFYVDGGSWVGRDAGATMFSGLSATPTNIDFVKLYEAGVYTSYIVWSQADGKVYFSKGTGDAPALRFTGAGTNRVVFRTVKNRIYMANGTMVPQVGRYGAGFRRWGVDAQVSVLTRDITSLPYYNTGTLQVTNGSMAIVGTGTVFNVNMVGQAIFLNGVKYTIATFTNGTHITIDSNYAGVNEAAMVGTTPLGGGPGWFINTGQMTWENGSGFQYAVSYYDPTVGHSSNVSPLLDVNDVDALANSTSVKIGNIQRTGDVVNFTQIIIWRTAHGGGILFPRDVIPNTPAGVTTYTDNNNSDTILGNVIGNFPAPLLTNLPPPADLNFIAYWNGRFWGSSVSNPGLLYFSAKNDPGEITIGVAEECWPAINTLPVEDNDGVITGCRVVGSSLYVMTGQKIYFVRGSDPINYQLLPVSSKGTGTQHFATTTMPGEDQNSSDILVHMGNDGHMYFLYGPGGDVSYSYPIQDQFRLAGGPKLSSNFFLSMFHSIKNTYVVVGDATGGGTTAWFYDIDRKIWMRTSIGYGPFAEGVTTNDGYVFVTGVGNFIIRITLDDAAGGMIIATPLQTQYQVPVGTANRADPKQLQMFSVYATGLVVGDITPTVSVDGAAFVSLAPVANTAVQVFNEPAQFDFVPTTPTWGLTFSYKVLLGPFYPRPGPHIQALRAKYSVSESQQTVNAEL